MDSGGRGLLAVLVTSRVLVLAIGVVLFEGCGLFLFRAGSEIYDASSSGSSFGGSD